ncbi:MAG: SIS domain-containing protein [Pseudohongiellaceae bacterium]
MQDIVIGTLTEARTFLDAFIRDEQRVQSVREAADVLIRTFKSGQAVYSCGNGGSMSDAMHFAEELTGRYRLSRQALAATAISDPGHLSCVANDFGYEQVFSRYLEGRGRPGDCLLAISTSGTSANVIRAAEFAMDNHMAVITLTGAPGSALGKLASVDISVGHSEFADRIQEMHIKIIHLLIEQVERYFFPENYRPGGGVVG